MSFQLTDSEKIKIKELQGQNSSFADIVSVMSSQRFGSSQFKPESFDLSSKLVNDVENGTNVTGWKSDFGADLSETGSNIFETMKAGTQETFQEAKSLASPNIVERTRGKIRTAGKVAETFNNLIGNLFGGAARAALSPEQEEKGMEMLQQAMTTDIVGETSAMDVMEGIDKQVQRLPDEMEQDVRAGAEIVGAVGTGGLGGVIGSGLKSGLRTSATGVSKFIDDVIKKEYDANPTFKSVVDEQDSRIEQAISNNNETKRSIIEQGVDLAVEAASGVAGTYKKLVDGSSERVARSLDEKAISENINLTPQQVGNNIADMYVNSVSPGVKGKKKSLAAINANKQSAVNSVKDIVNNRENIRFRDIETNEMVQGELPSNLWEYGGAITERKSDIYNQILDSIEKTGDFSVDSNRIVTAMTEITQNPVYDAIPTIKNKAEGVIELFTQNKYNPSQVEELIKIYNDSLQAFYRGGGTQADAVVDAMVANHLRDILDETVEQATGDGIKDLKRLYGNYRSIENDVVHRALHNDQAREAGLVDMFGIRNIGDLSASIGTGGLSNLRQSAGQIIGEGFVKALNDRDALINRMFLVGDKVYSKAPDS